MSEGEICATASKVESKTKLMNAQTQHGCEENADEENIVLFSKNFSISPDRETSDEVVWHEEFVATTLEPDDVSWIFSYKYQISNYFQWRNFLPEKNFLRKTRSRFASNLNGLIERLNSILRLLNVYTLWALSEQKKNCIHRRETPIRGPLEMPPHG